MKNIIKDPLVAFLLLSVLIFGYYNYINDGESADRDQILIEDSDIDRLIDLYQRTWNAPPDEPTLKKLIDQEVKNEIFYQEGLEMNLDHNDEIIRRRLVQKYEFLIKDLSEYIEPTDTELKSFYDQHTDLYLTDPLYTFDHIYFSPDRRDDPEQDAVLISKSINDIDGQIGDAFHISSPQVRRSKNQLSQSFGKKFSDALTTLDGWGVVQSGYGYHLIRINEKIEAQTKSYKEVATNVLNDYKASRLKEHNAKIYQALKSEYEVRFNLKKWKAIYED